MENTTDKNSTKGDIIFSDGAGGDKNSAEDDITFGDGAQATVISRSNAEDGLVLGDEAQATVIRGNKSLDYFCTAYGILLANALALISIFKFGTVCNAVIIIITLGSLGYFSFRNRWFRNKIVKFFTTVKEMEE